jgi:hypothetical protein
MVAALSLGAPAPAFAHANHGEPMYGGVVAEAGMFQGELVVKGNQFTIHITSHGEPVSTAGAQAKVTVLAGTQKVEFTLSPSGENRFAGAPGVPLASGARAVVAVRLADGRAGSLRFEVR